MALKITKECTSCDACLPECPNEAISVGDDIYIIDPDLCTECVGFHGAPQCAEICPVECCEDDPDRKEEEIGLLAKAKKIHPDQEIPDNYPSRYKEMV